MLVSDRHSSVGRNFLAMGVGEAIGRIFAEAGLFAKLAIGTTAYLLSLVAMRALDLRGGLPSLDL